MKFNIYITVLCAIMSIMTVSFSRAASPSGGSMTNVVIEDPETKRVVATSLSSEKFVNQVNKGYAGKLLLALLALGSGLIALSYGISRAAKVPFDMVTISRVSGISAACYIALTQGIALLG